MTSALSDLPVEEVVPELRVALAEGTAAVLVAPPGSGKTTIVPLRLLDEPWLGDRKVLVLEPRRLAARAAAHRMSDLLGTEVGGIVGYTTRDDRSTSAATRIEVVTEGILTRRLQSNPELADTGIVIFDEFHERNLQTDLGLAFALDVQTSIRPDLRILVMSATVDAERIARVLVKDEKGSDGERSAPVITSDARQHPVDVRWAPPKPPGGGKRRRGPAGHHRFGIDEHIANLILQTLDAELGDILVFLPGMGEINRVQRRLEGAGAAAEIHRLHGSLPLDEQHAAIFPSSSPVPRRKVVLSTDIAETSLTVEGVRVVIDSGLTRSPRFDAHTGMTRLQTVSISKASADQRSGRAGRTEPGIAYRAWSKIDHGTRKPHTPPEITQIDLASLVVELRAWGVRDPTTLTFLDPPATKAWDEAIELLTALGLLTGADDPFPGSLTDLGRTAMNLPVHPRLGRMIADADDGDQWLACILAALISERDPFRGKPSEVPTDLALRVGLVDRNADGPQGFGYPNADRRTVDRVRRVAKDLARRARIGGADRASTDNTGRTLALAFPDRLAIRRGTAGRFQLRTRTTAWVPEGDSLASEEFLVAADLDGQRKDSRIRLAAALDKDDLLDRFADQIEAQVTPVWDGDKLTIKRESRLGGVTLGSHQQRAEPGEQTAALIADRLASDITRLNWSDQRSAIRHRVNLLHRTVGEPWPDWSNSTLAASVEMWMGPTLLGVIGIDEVNRLGPDRILERTLDPRLRGDLDRLAPTHLELPSGRRVEIDYSGDEPQVSSRVQDFFGLTETPTIGGQPILVELLSPAQRPVQLTRDIGGFWQGSWHDVRKDMAGRYPKHSWPENP